MIKIPNQNKKFSQSNDSDNSGNIWSSYNLDLSSNVGRIRVSPRGMLTTRQTNGTDMETPVSFAFLKGTATDQIWTIAGRMLHNEGKPSDEFYEDTLVGSPAVDSGSDMELFNGGLYVVGTQKIMRLNLGVWTEVGTDEGSSVPTATCIYSGRMYYTTDYSAVNSIDLSNAVSNPSAPPTNSVEYTLQLANFGVGGSLANFITCMKASSNRIWIATMDATSSTGSSGRGAKIFEWDGSSTEANKVYNISSIGVLAMTIKDDVPYAIDADGKLLAYTGGAFTEIAQLPIPKNKYLKNPISEDPVTRFIHPRGMTVVDDKIQILINNAVQGSNDTIENIPSGIWEYDEKIGLYHKWSLSLWENDSTTERTDYAQNRLAEVGALFNAKSVNPSVFNGDILAGARFYTTATERDYGIFINDSNDTAPKIGYLVTPKIDSEQVEDVWQKIWLLHKPLLDSTDKIIVKYRTRDVPPVEATITWASQTTFTTTEDLSDYAVGDEVEITAGTGSGQIERISTISLSSSTYTVTLENAVTGADGTAKARFQHWIQIGTQTSQELENIEMSIGINSNWVQIKLIMYFTGENEVNNLQIINKTHQKSV